MSPKSINPNHLAYPTIVCNCGIIFSVFPYEIEKRKFCSIKCRTKYKKYKGLFIKGHLGYKGMLGKNHSEKTKKHLSEIHKGQIPWMKGKKHTKESLKKMSEHLKGQIPWNKGLKGFLGGEKHFNWKGGITSTNHKIRTSFEYRLWRESVFKRDNWTCIWCNKRGCKLCVDHIKSFAFYPEKRFELSNGRTLCVSCHKKTDTWGSRIKI